MFIIASTSFGMHWLQRRRRERLRRRVANGEVDLEQLGIKKLTVPLELLEKMPLYNYPGTTEKSEIQETATTDTPDKSGIENAGTDIEKDIQQPTPTKPQTTPAPQTAYSQPTCAICLEDFVPSESLVRELPCRHIFHSECVDTFLRENSSLCPLCKKTSLPRGYCPPIITNVMVRRERMMRRMRDRVPSNGDPEAGLRHPWSPATWRRRGRSALNVPARMRARAHSLAMRTGPHATSESLTMTPALPPVSQSETTPRDDDAGAATTIAPPAAAVDDHGPGSEWARRRAVAMAGVQGRTDEDEERRPRWKRITGKIWPGLA
jgi:RING finger family protein